MRKFIRNEPIFDVTVRTIVSSLEHTRTYEAVLFDEDEQFFKLQNDKQQIYIRKDNCDILEKELIGHKPVNMVAISL
jgi:hypothetical protein